MSIDIGQYIEFLILKTGKVSIKGMGTILLESIPASFSHAKTKLHPPERKFSFTSDEGSNSDLINLIAENEGLSIADATSVVTIYDEEVLNKLLNYDTVKINDLGYLEKVDDKISFIPAMSEVSKNLDGLKVLDVKPYKKYVAPITIDNKLTNSQIGVSLINENEWLNYLASLLLGGLMVMAFHHFIDPYGNGHTRKEIHHENVSSTKKRQENSKVSELDKIENDKITSDRQSLKSATDTTSSESSEIKSINSVEDGNDTSSVVLAKPKDDQQCIILVGIHANTLEALTQVDKIKAAGFKVFRDVKYDTHRVGVQFTCNDKDPKEMLEIVRKKFGKQANYLQPKLSI